MSQLLSTNAGAGETEGARRATGVSPAPASAAIVQTVKFSPPDPEVSEKAERRRFSAKYKLKILQQADACVQSGELGALLRREGLYSSYLTTWKRQRDQGILGALSPKKRGRKAAGKDPLKDENARLRRENEKLQQRLAKAELIIDVQKKISQILALPQETAKSSEND